MKENQLEQRVQAVINSVDDKQLDNWFNEYVNTTEQAEPGEELIDIGEVLPFDNPRFIVHVMERWVEQQERKIEQIRKETEDIFMLALAFSQRGITLDEFRYVMSGKRPSDYKNHPAFYYLHIINEEAHDYFIATNSDEEKDTTALYLDRVEKFVLLEIPTLKEFFFTYFRKLFPFSSLERHTYILGGTGSGKSEVLKYLFYNLWSKSKERRNYSLISLEPHGKLSYELLQFNLLASDPKRVVYLDPFLRKTAKRLCGEDVLGEDFTFIFNPFDLPRKTPDDINYATQELSYGLFEILESEGASRQMKALVRACVSTLLVNDGMSISDLKRFMDDDDNHDLVQAGLKNPNTEHRKLFTRFDHSSISPTKSGIYYRLLSLIDDIHLRRILVGKSTVDIEQEINAGKVIICNLAKGAMGKESAPTLGKLLVSLIQGYATKREGSTTIKPTFLFMDEAQNYLTPSVETLLGESRKYGLHLVAANQILHQLGKFKPIILGNTAIKLCGNVDLDSAEKIAKTLGIKFKEFENLKAYHFFSQDNLNKKAGTVKMKVPPNLVKVKPPYYVGKSTLRSYFLWLAHESGYYIKTPVEAPISHKKQGQGKGKPGEKIYPNTFND